MIGICKHKTLALMALCLFTVAAAYADDDNNTVKDKIDTLQTEIRNDFIKIHKLKNKLKIKYVRVDSLKQLIVQNKILKPKVRQLQKDSIAIMQRREKAVSEVNKQWLSRLEALKKQHQTDSTDLAATDKDLKTMKAFQQKYVDNLVAAAKNEWLSKSFAQLDADMLKKAYQPYQELAANDDRVAQALKDMNTLQQQTVLYEKGYRAVTSAYDSAIVNNLLPQIETLLDQTAGTERNKEVKNLYKQLYYYQTTVQIFQELIGEIDNIVNKGKDQNTVWKEVNRLIDKQEREDEVRSSIEAIPWLKEVYEKYIQQIEADFTAPNGARSAIMNLKP